MKLLLQIFVKLRTTNDKHSKYRQRQTFLKKMPIRAAISDIYSDRPKNNIIIKFNICVIHVL